MQCDPEKPKESSSVTEIPLISMEFRTNFSWVGHKSERRFVMHFDAEISAPCLPSSLSLKSEHKCVIMPWSVFTIHAWKC